MKQEEKTKFAAWGEEQAASYLKSEQYKLVRRNFYAAYGEIDIICFYENTLVFCEVKTRTSTQPSHEKALLSVSRKKQQKLKKTAEWFILKNPQYESCFTRFDVISILLYRHQVFLKHIQDAFR